MRSETLTEFWQYRELLYFFAWRDIKVRYRQAAFGAAWAVIQPLLNMIIFTLLFGRVAHFQSGNIPYPIFVYCALLPWTYISGVLGVASMSLVNNDPLLTKVYFPRALLPAGSVLAGLLDFVIGSFLLVGLMFYYHVQAGWSLLLSPLVILLMVLLTMGVSMVTAALNVRYRDVRYALPFLIQVGLYATPIVYPATMIPKRFQPILALNPCWGIVDGLRACLFPGQPFNFKLMGTSVAVAILVFVLGAFYFHRAEKSFADVI
ncbi:MAG TPA: ABC transporter permease [Terriglobales bacterium]|nr:ABC transporter permease [Terriglobales bacterium]